jgi:hypothetical protein
MQETLPSLPACNMRTSHVVPQVHTLSAIQQHQRCEARRIPRLLLHVAPLWQGSAQLRVMPESAGMSDSHAKADRPQYLQSNKQNSKVNSPLSQTKKETVGS